MFVASYLPIPEHRIRNADPGIRAPLYNMLGAEPVWCFCADSAIDFWVNSLLSVPVCPEQLYVASVDTKDLLAVYKPDWDAYLNSNGQTPMPVPVRVQDINYDDLWRFELLAPDFTANGRLIYAVNMYGVMEAFLNGQYDGGDAAYSKIVDRGINDAVMLGKSMAMRSSHKTEEQFINQSAAFYIRNVYLSTLACYDYINTINDGYVYEYNPLNIDFAEYYYTTKYMKYDGNPSMENLEELHDYLFRIPFKSIYAAPRN